MVVLSAAILTKTGKVLLSRQFVETSRIRIEGLLSAFPKLMGTGKQYTYFETDTVRYVYQPIETLYLVLITNRSSNIVEDLDTLRLLGRIVPDYCQPLEEETIQKKAFDLLFAFDEIIQLGYRENLSWDQVKTVLEMHSIEEELANAVKESKIAEAKSVADAKRRELEKRPTDSKPSSFMPSFPEVTTPSTPEVEAPAPRPTTNKPGAGMKLGRQRQGKEALVTKAFQSGQLEEGTGAAAAPAQPAHTQNVRMEAVHLKVDEKINAVLNNDGGFQSLELIGNMYLTVSDSSCANVKVQLNQDGTSDYVWRTHPKINKQSWSRDRILTPSDPTKPFPVGSSLQILRWRLQNTQGFTLPLSVNCWPSDNSVTLEFELERPDVVLNNVVIAIPLGSATPTASPDVGEARFDPSTQCLQWVLERIDGDNSAGSMDIELDEEQDASVYFPLAIDFFGESTLANVSIVDIMSNDTGLGVTFSSEVVLAVDRYEVAA